MTIIELVATVAGLACVLLTIRQNIWCWPVGLVMVSLYIYIFYQAKLYSDMGLQVVYVFLQFYGWYQWLYGSKDRGKLNVQRLPRFNGFAWVFAAAIGTGVLGYVMSRYTDAALPYWDAATTVLSLIAQYLMARKYLESWLFWITVDVLSIGIYTTKSLYLTSGLYAVFLGLAIAGFYAWQKSIHPSQDTAAPD